MWNGIREQAVVLLLLASLIVQQTPAPPALGAALTVIAAALAALDYGHRRAKEAVESRLGKFLVGRAATPMLIVIVLAPAFTGGTSRVIGFGVAAVGMIGGLVAVGIRRGICDATLQSRQGPPSANRRESMFAVAASAVLATSPFGDSGSLASRIPFVVAAAMLALGYASRPARER
jgi:hypothetical protein